MDLDGLLEELGFFPEELVSSFPKAIVTIWNGWKSVALGQIVSVWFLYVH